MPHIGLIFTGFTGNLNSSLEVAYRLKSEGHKITCLSVLDLKEQIERYDLAYVQLPPIKLSLSTENLGRLQNLSWIKKFLFHLENKERIIKDGNKLLGLDVYEKIISDLHIDKVLIDKELHDLIFVCYALKIPTTILSTWFSNKMGNGTKLPPLRSDIIPNKGIKGSALGILFNWIYIKIKVQFRIFLNNLTFKGYRRAALLRYAKENGFPTDTLIATNLPIFFSYTNLPFISFTMAEMDFPHQPERNFYYAGPMVHEKRKMMLNITENNLLDNILRLKEHSRKKLIYCAASSLLDPDLSFLKKVISAVEEKDEWMLIISLGGKLPPNRLETESSNVHIIYWVPQMKVLEHTDCCITHAGNNSVNECIHFSVPMLAYSGKKFDQNGCAARIHYHGLGIRGDKDKDDALQIRKNIKRIFEEPSFKEKMNFFHRKYREYGQRKLTPLLA